MGRYLNRVTGPTDLIVTETGGSPNVLYYADRRGWMLDRQYDPAVLERFCGAGAVWYADAFVNDATEPGAGFSVDTNRVTFIDGDGLADEQPLLAKSDVADLILDRVERLMQR